jgi:geranylgeranyl diphosphate synthase type II
MVETTSEFARLEQTLEDRRLKVEKALRRLVVPGRAAAVEAAIEMSLFAPAKRLRPVLALLVAEVLKGDPDAVLPAGCAIEMVHTASLAAFALMNRGFEILACGWEGGPDAVARSRVARELCQAIGTDGMIAGQSLDLQMTDREIDFQALEFIHSRKTGALFMAAAALGALSARAHPSELAAVVAYAKNLGLAFQIVDDLIDVTGGAEAGKDTGKDVKKTTFVSFSGIEGARALAGELVAASQTAIEPFGPRGAPLGELARYVVTRKR